MAKAASKALDLTIMEYALISGIITLAAVGSVIGVLMKFLSMPLV